MGDPAGVAADDAEWTCSVPWRQDFPEATAEGLSASLAEATNPAALREAVEFHVATDGSDRNPGSQAAPFATLERS